jgi:hypothetical protein
MISAKKQKKNGSASNQTLLFSNGEFVKAAV